MEEIIKNSGLLTIVKIRKLFQGLPDLERGLVRIYFGKVTTTQELLKILQAFQRVGDVFEAVDAEDVANGAATAAGTVKSPLLKKIITALPTIKVAVDDFLSQLNIDAAREGRKDEIFQEQEMFEALHVCPTSLTPESRL